VSKILVPHPLSRHPHPRSIKRYENAFIRSVVVTNRLTERQTWRRE